MRQALQTILLLPGAVYCGVVDQSTGEVLIDVAEQSPFGAEVVEWAMAVAALSNDSRTGSLDDIMVTSHGHHHVVRRFAAAGHQPVLAVLVLDRAVSNLAIARRELAASGLADVLLTALSLPAAPLTPLRLPRRSGSSRGGHRWLPPPVAHPPEPPERSEPSVLRQRWANDTSTLRQLLVGLRNLA